MDLARARAYAERLDAEDPLAHARRRFSLPPGVIYLDGNSLGPLPAHVPAVVGDVVRRQWGENLIRSWNEHDWWTAPQRVGARVASLLGAEDDEVLVADSTTVNLFKVVVAASRLRPERRVVLVEPSNFPADLYVVDSVAELLGLEVRRVEPEDVATALGGDVALACFSHADYRTGRLHDMAAVTRAVQDAGAVAVWDLCHSAGVVAVELNRCNVDFAVGCGYKYLNGGPGAPAYVMVARRHIDQVRQPIAGWTGHAQPFGMESSYRPGAGITRMGAGTPPIVSLLTLEAALTAYDGLDLGVVRAKSLSLTRLFIDLTDEVLAPVGFRLGTPRADTERGSQIALMHPEAYGVVQALLTRGVIGDFRAPDVVRLGFAPLYVRHVDVVSAAEHLVAVLAAGEQRDPAYAVQHIVT